jgi:hypothetical protein
MTLVKKKQVGKEKRSSALPKNGMQNILVANMMAYVFKYIQTSHLPATLSA